MSQIIVKTRIIPRKITDNIVSRKRLFKKFDENRQKSLIFVLGPAGYGKTTSVLDYLNSSGTEFAWLHINSDIENAGVFLSYFIHSLKVLKPEFGDIPLELVSSLTADERLTRDTDGSIRSTTGAIVNDFVNNFTEDTYIVLDDLHNLAGTLWLNTFFECLTENMPDNFHLIITSRNVPEFNIAKLKAKRKLAMIESNDLNFSAEETESLVKDIYSFNCRKEDIEQLLGKMEGWITGLHLVLQAYGIDFSKAADSGSLMNDDFFSYFAEDIFSQLTPELQDFTVLTSMLDEFTPETCSNILGLPESEKFLEELLSKNLFIESSQIIVQEGTIVTEYSYHYLFRQFLQKKLNEIKPNEAIKEIADKIFRYYYDANEILKAIGFALISENLENAAKLITENYEMLLLSAGYEKLKRWMNELPDELYKGNPELLFVKGKIINFFKKDNLKALEIFNEVIKTKEISNSLRIKTNSEISEIYRLTGKPDEAINIFKELYKLDPEPKLKLSVIISLCKGYYRLGSAHYKEIIELLSEAENINSLNNTDHYRDEIFSLYGRVYLNKGEFVKALHYFEANLNSEKNIYRRFHTTGDIILLYSWQAEYNKARSYYEDAEAIIKKYSLHHLETDLLRLNAILRFEAGDYEESSNCFSSLLNLYHKKNVTSFDLTFNLILSEISLLKGKKEKASEYMELAYRLKNPNDEYLNSELEYHRAILVKAAGFDPKTEKILLNTLKHYENTSSLYDISQVKFHLAELYYKKNELQTSLKFLTESLLLAKEHNYLSFLVQHFHLNGYLFDLAISNRLLREFVKELKIKITERNNLPWLSDECRTRLDAESKKLYDISLYTFGGAELYLRGVALKEDAWVRKKSKLLLIYLLINRGLKIQKDKILGIFFSELSPESADNIFHQAITNIRNVLKPDTGEKIPAGEKKKKSVKTAANEDNSPSFISYEDKILQISAGFDYYTDVQHFSSLAAAVKSPETEISAKEKAAKEAISLYRGEFLPGYYDEWIEEMRSVMEHKFIETCEELLAVLYKLKKFEELTEYAERLLLTDMLHEEAYYYVISGYKELGNINMARKKFSQLIKNYEDEYAEKPPKKLLEKISVIIENN